MSTIQEMLKMSGNSFQKAEQMALDFIVKGHPDIYLDLALLLHAQGKIEGARQANAQYTKIFPECARGRLSLSWFKFYDGDLNAAWDHFDHSRVVGTLPNKFPFDKPHWQGESVDGKTVLLVGEGGLGDQVLGARSASFLADRGAKVIASCSRSLMPLLAGARGVNSVVEVGQEKNAHFDVWIPAFSSFRHCDLNWEKLYPGKYVEPIGTGKLWDRIIPKDGKPNIGLRWRGNPQYEHEQFRVFPVELMWNAISDAKANFWSLQKDDHANILPEAINDLDPLLGTWEMTVQAISRMDLVITSCTAIAHVAGAMNVPVWVVVPVMCYWPWAKQGNTSPWYPSVRLFRQEKFGDWTKPFAAVKEALQKWA